MSSPSGTGTPDDVPVSRETAPGSPPAPATTSTPPVPPAAAPPAAPPATALDAPPPLPAWLQPSADRLVAYAQLLAGPGVERGLIGPRELPRLWDRHLLNCAVVADPALGLVPPAARVVDVGSGAGLPGLVWALVRPDVRVTLIEPLLRRATFLREAVASLAVDVDVLRVRAEDLGRQRPAGWDVVTARAVAPLDRLAGWTLPLARPGGVLLALKGSSAADEVRAAGPALRRLGAVDVAVVECGAGLVDPPTTVVRARRDARGSATAPSPRGGRTSGRSR